MPIKPENRTRYPANWSEIRAAILARAADCCEGTAHFPQCRAENRKKHPETSSLVVLTIAHLDHQPENSEPENLRALCQRCHLDWDRDHHRREAAATRRRTRRQLEFPELKP
jgi:5-methylcytosine-specific restriction endonuclease McrA